MTVANHNNINVKLTPTTKDDRIAVKGEDFIGTLFTRDYDFTTYNSAITSERRFTPSLEEIRFAEIALKGKIKRFTKMGPNQGGDCPIIYNNMPNYFRQYVGYRNDEGDKTLHINFYWKPYNVIDEVKESFSDTFEGNYHLVFDGCSYYWSVNVDLTTGKLSGLSVNGSA